ncbi:PEP-CTERM sorting domain-containing protein [Alteromonas ponticola]|uniref:PEP-CTERM sorting domain-containing protein n=1 Tax=Alteromonas ponticola TaxID=2720613 RepID=A0ABX1R5Q3_9ALTE|nr:PEP-CTERM sorting domain-containing protein [Alteromonas ponticola]NMH61404.1 PEP-CTERM sorting domain-containing protein [Alteromonas ponticola]
MNKLTKFFILQLLLITGAANAALITSVNKTTNDGVYTLSTEQADQLGVSGADRIAFLRLREGNGVNWNVGDYFNVSTILNSTNNDSKIMGIFNGWNVDLTYVGDDFDTFTTATIDTDLSGFVEGIAFAFSSTSGNIVFNGTSTFNGGQTRGDADFLTASVPEPGTILTLSLGLFGLMARRLIK